MEYFVNEGDVARPPTHPGEILREDVLPELGMSVAKAARIIGVSRRTLARVLKGERPVTAELSLRIGMLCGNGPNIWLALQQSYDLYHARLRYGADLERIPTLGA